MQGDANSFTANTFRPERDSAKKQTKLICVVCIVTVNRAISIGKKLEGNYCNWTMRDSSKLVEVVYKNELKLLICMNEHKPRIRFERILTVSRSFIALFRVRY